MNWANRVTLIRIAFIPLVTAALVVNLGDFSPWFAAALFIVIAATDALDGYLARSRNEVTTFGKFLDPLADKLLVTAALVALVELGSLPAWIAIIIISREFIVSGLRMVAVAEGVVIAASNYGKLKTVFQMIAIVAFILLDAPLIQDSQGVHSGRCERLRRALLALVGAHDHRPDTHRRLRRGLPLQRQGHAARTLDQRRQLGRLDRPRRGCDTSRRRSRVGSARPVWGRHGTRQRSSPSAQS